MSKFKENGTFIAYNGDIVNIGNEVCFIINGRTGSSTIRTLLAKGTVNAISESKARITIIDIESNYQRKPNDVVDVYFGSIIALNRRN